MNDYYKLLVIVRSLGGIAVTTPGFQTMNDAEIAAKQIAQFDEARHVSPILVVRLYDQKTEVNR